VTETHKLLLTFILTLAGSGVGTTIVAALLKRTFDERIELLKAVLERGSRIHERQVEALMAIHSKLEGATFYLQRVASPGRLKGEDDTSLLQRAAEELASASSQYSEKRLLLSETLTGMIDEFFEKVLSTRVSIDSAMQLMLLDGAVRAAFWQKAQESAYKELPAILGAIRSEARGVIHGAVSR
jgi:hypothetical protein